MIDHSNSKFYHNQSRLLIAGSGLMILAVWSFMKAILYFTMARSSAMALMGDGLKEATVGEGVIYGLASGIILFFLFLDMLLKLYIGRAARSEARGKKRRGFYLFLAWCMAILDVISIVLEIRTIIFWNKAHEGLGFGDTCASIVLDVVVLCILVWLIRSAAYIRKVRKQTGQPVQPGTAGQERR